MRVKGLVRRHWASAAASPGNSKSIHRMLFALRDVPFESHDYYSNKSILPFGRMLLLERVKGLEPSISAWKANVLPLHYTRMIFCFWCGRRDLNSYACAALEPKSSASANSATPAVCAANAKMVTRRRFELRTP